MQIHELTQKKQVELEEGIIDSVKSGIAGAKQGYQASKTNRAVGKLADKAYRAWKGYEAQLLKSDPKAKEDGTYETQLLAFVNKNLLGGMYLPNVINKDKITGLVKKIASIPAPTGGAGAFGQIAGQLSQGPAVGTQSATGTGGTATTTAAGQVHKANPNNPNLQPTATPLAPAATTTSAALSGTTPPSKIIVPQKVGGSPRQPTPANPAIKIPYGSAPVAGVPFNKDGTLTIGGVRRLPGSPEYNNAVAASKKPTMNEATDPIKDLFKQLVQQCAVAQTAAPGSSTTPGKAAQQTTPAGDEMGPSGSAQEMKQTLVQQLDPAIAKGLPALGAKAAKLTGNKQVKSTGNPGADGLLIMMGFEGIQ